MQGIGRKLACAIETRHAGVLQQMFAVTAAHSLDTSEARARMSHSCLQNYALRVYGSQAEYALDADAFKGSLFFNPYQFVDVNAFNISHL